MRPYESRECFVARFCEQNGVSPDQAIKYIGMGTTHIGRDVREEVMHVSSILRERKEIVRTVLRPLLRAPAFEVRNHFSHKSKSNIMRLCPECAKLGYYSNFHEMKWLSLCPLHDCDLEECHIGGDGRSFFERRVSFLRDTLREKCSDWPAFGTKHRIEITDNAKRIIEWLCLASVAMMNISSNQIWTTVNQDENILDLLGQAQRMVPAEPRIERYLVDRYALWHIERKNFGLDVKNRVEEMGLSPGLSFDLAYYFYKRLGGNKSSGVDFLEDLSRAKDGIVLRHGVCKCQWKYSEGRWWRSEVFRERNWLDNCSGACPFEVAISIFDAEWGVAPISMSSHDLREYDLEMTDVSRMMRNADLIHYSNDANLSPEGLLYLSKDPLSFCKWNSESVLADLFASAAKWEIELLSAEFSKWLDGVENGLSPDMIKRPRDCIRLIKVEEGVTLMKWVKII
nr:TniQ family protein [Burkholderia stabilis]